MKYFLIFAVVLSTLGGCDDSGEAAYYPPIPAADTTNTIDLQGPDLDTVSTDHDELKINLSQIAGANRPTFVTVTVEMDEGKIIAYTVTTKSKPHAVSSSNLNYTIQKGDTKMSLSRRFGVPISRIPNLIAGKKLVLK